MDVELSLIGTAPRRSQVERLLQDFEERHSLRVKTTYYSWDSAWSGIMVNTKKGVTPAISEVGTSWVPDLAGIEVLQPVPDDVLAVLGGEKEYVSQSWKSCFLFGYTDVWAVPWICGSRVLYYRKDLLRKAGVDPEIAFVSPESMLAAVRQLKSEGVALPWVTSNVTSLNTLHLISTWIWAGGGDFISEDGEHLLFAEPGAIESMAAFFEMGRLMGIRTQSCTYSNAIDMFWRGDAAITMDGTWTFDDQRPSAHLNVLDHLGVALAPGPAFVGGSNLVVWANEEDNGPAWDLVKFLSEPASVQTICELTGLAPARLNLLNSHEALNRSFVLTLNRAMETGRSFSNHRFSGMVEDNLHYAFGLVWTDVLKFPKKDPREILTSYLVPLKNRLEAAMK